MLASAQLELLPAASVPALLAPDARAKARTLEFFTAHIRNPNTRKAYARAGQHFADWCERFGISDIRQVKPVQVALYVEQLDLAAPSVKEGLHNSGSSLLARTRSDGEYLSHEAS